MVGSVPCKKMNVFKLGPSPVVCTCAVHSATVFTQTPCPTLQGTNIVRQPFCAGVISFGYVVIFGFSIAGLSPMKIQRRLLCLRAKIGHLPAHPILAPVGFRYEGLDQRGSGRGPTRFAHRPPGVAGLKSCPHHTSAQAGMVYPSGNPYSITSLQ